MSSRLSPDDVEAFLRDNSQEQVFETLAQLTAEDRTALVPKFRQMASIYQFRLSSAIQEERIELSKAQRGIPATEEPTANLATERTKLWLRPAIDRCATCLLFCCEYNELKEAGHTAVPSTEYAVKVIATRKPKWISQWCKFILAARSHTNFFTVYRLEQLGLVKLKHDSNYLACAAQSLTSVAGMADFIAASPQLIQDVIDILKSPLSLRAMAIAVSPDSNAAPLNEQKTSFVEFCSEVPSQNEHANRWLNCIQFLAEKNIITNDTVIESSFSQLFSASEIPEKKKNSWAPSESTTDFLIALHDRIAVDKSNLSNRYIPLIAASNTAIASYAMNNLLNTPTDKLVLTNVLSYLPMVFNTRSKELSDLAFKLLKKLEPRAMEKQELYDDAVLSALTHKSGVTHKQALNLIQKMSLLKNSETLNKFETRITWLEGINRSRARDLLEAAKRELANTATKTPDKQLSEIGQGAPLLSPVLDCAPSITQAIEEMIANNFNAKDALSELAGFDHLAQTYSASERDNNKLADAILKPIDLYSFEYPRLSDSTRVSPINDTNDLIIEATRAIAGKKTAEETEQVVDGIARMWKNRPTDFTEKMAPLTSRLEAETQTQFQLRGISLPLYPLVFSWFFGLPITQYSCHPFATIWTARIVCMAERMRQGLELPMLAAPTHKGGWIDPTELVRRIKLYQQSNRLLFDSLKARSKFDFLNPLKSLFKGSDNASTEIWDSIEMTQALLRIAPDKQARQKALNQCHEITGEIAQAMKYALGSGSIDSIELPYFQVAAHRARDPFTSCKIKGEDLGLPDTAEAATYVLNKEAFVNSRASTQDSLNNAIKVLKVTHSNIYKTLYVARNAPSDRLSHIAELVSQSDYYYLYPTSMLHSFYTNIFAPDFQEDFVLVWPLNMEPVISNVANLCFQYINSSSQRWLGQWDFLFSPDLTLAKNGSWLLCFALANNSNETARLALDLVIAAVDENRADAKAIGNCIVEVSDVMSYKPSRLVKVLRELSKVSPLHALFTWEMIETVVKKLKGRTLTVYLELALELVEEYGFALTKDSEQELANLLKKSKPAILVAKMIQRSKETTNIQKRQEAYNQATLQSLQSRLNRQQRWASS